MALPATDDFTTGSDQAIEDYSANWTINSGAMQVLAASDDVHSNTASADTGAHWNADTFDDDQYSQATVSALSGTYIYIGICARAAASAETYYFYESANNDKKYLTKRVAGSNTELASSANVWSASDDVRLETNGTTITPILNASTDTDLGAQTDSSITSGSAGVMGWGSGNVARVDDWEGGNLAGASTASDSQPAYLAGSIDVSDSQAAYMAGASTASDSQPAYLAGSIDVSDSQAAYMAGASTASDSQPAYLAGSIDVSDSQAAYMAGQNAATDNQVAYIEGLTYFPFTEDFSVGGDGDPWRVSHWVTDVG
jgi:hypothetical protein